MGSINTTSTTEDLPYWQANVAPDHRETECPPFLLNLSDKDRGIIGTPDSEYTVATWPEVQQIIAGNRLDAFRRVPSQLRKYLEYTSSLKREYGSVMNFVLSKRLGWDHPSADKVKVTGTPAASTTHLPNGDLKSQREPFASDDDIKILWNDWPYGIDPKIVHLVVWTKFDLEEDPVTTDLTDRARSQIEDFVMKKFALRVPRESFIWFKNWRSLKSVQAVEHFHVMLYDPDPDFIREITNGDIPLCDKV